MSSSLFKFLPEVRNIREALNATSQINKGITTDKAMFNNIFKKEGIKNGINGQNQETSSLMNLTGRKDDKNNLGMTKIKKTVSHLSEYLNKSKGHSSMGTAPKKLPYSFIKSVTTAKKWIHIPISDEL